MKLIFKISAYIILIWIVAFISCKRELSCESCNVAVNKLPIALAGPDQIITLPTDSISLDGSASSDPDGKISAWLWTKISGPASFAIKNTTAPTTVVKKLTAGAYQFELTVTDDGGLSARDTLRVIVDSVLTTNHPPVACAGADKVITLPTNADTLTGNCSTDPDNNIVVYLWTKVAGPSSVNITNANAVQTRVTNLVQGMYQFELKVTDAGQLFSKDTIQIVVNPTSLNCDISLRQIINAQLVPIGTLSQGRHNLVTATAGSKILFAGGFIPLAYSTRIDIYDFVTNTWATAELSEGGRE
jgi:hypothetical protein